ncbi:MAG: ABC transporter ATP-binding protein/permease, partial [Desulfobacterales bacterium]|nr:ABC transporter ATP-binding protein/permease [Desulfobacterales bacterium]
MMIHTMKKVTGNNLGCIKRPFLSAVLEGFFIAAPYAVLAVVLSGILNGQMDAARFWGLYGLMILLFAGRFVLSLESNGGGMIAGYRVGGFIRLHLGEHLRTLPMGFFAQRDTGELVNRLFHVVGMVEMMIGHFLTQAIRNVSTPFAVFGVLAWISLPMAGIMAVLLAVALPFLWGLIKFVDRQGKERVVLIDKSSSHILEYLHGINVLKAFNLAGPGFRRLDKVLRELRHFSLWFEVKCFAVSLTYSALLELGFVALLFGGLILVRNGKLGIPEMVIFLVVGLKFYRPLHRLSENSALTRAAFGGVKAVEEIFDEPSIEGDVTAPPPDFTIRFEDVCFGYGATDVIKNVSFTAREKSMTALVGPSGCGKSTLVKLMARFWDAGRGRVTIGRQNIKTMNPDALLSNMSMVFQDVYLFNTTIFNNICFGKTSAGMEHVVAAARKAQCHEFIKALPHGYDTIIGEGGATLSGGEKQRISIARAILK